MLLSFKTKFKNGNPTLFVEKIINGLHMHIAFNKDAPTDFYQNLWLLATQYTLRFDNNDKGVSLNSELKPKIHSIREDTKTRWKAGNKIHFYINNRTKKMFQFAPVVPCISVQTIEIKPNLDLYDDKIISVRIDNRELNETELLKLVHNDGFDSISSFAIYFDAEFNGKIIHWTNHKY